MNSEKTRLLGLLNNVEDHWIILNCIWRKLAEKMPIVCSEDTKTYRSAVYSEGQRYVYLENIQHESVENLKTIVEALF